MDLISGANVGAGAEKIYMPNAFSGVDINKYIYIRVNKKYFNNKTFISLYFIHNKNNIHTYRHCLTDIEYKDECANFKA